MRTNSVFVFTIGLILTASTAAIAAECGPASSAQCGAKEWCSFSRENACGVLGEPGECKPRPEICTREFLPVCGCDGLTYSNACEAHSRGASIASPGACPAMNEGACIQVITCGIKDGQPKEYPDPCSARQDGASNIAPKSGPTCPALE